MENRDNRGISRNNNPIKSMVEPNGLQIDNSNFSFNSNMKKQKKLTSSSLFGFYVLASNLYCQVAAKRSTITALALGKNVHQKKKMYALLKQCHKNISIITQVALNANVSQLPIDTCKKDHALLCLLVHDLLWNPELAKDHAKMQDFLSTFSSIDSCKTRIRAEWARLSIKGCVYKNSTDEESTAKKTKYARINTLVEPHSPMEVVNELKKNYQGSVTFDDLVPNLIRFDDFSNFQFHKCQLVKDGRLVVQDKASCFSALFLNPTPGSITLDACAAPGNKTTHLAAMMNNEGSIIPWAIISLGLLIAVERSVERFKLLESNIQQYHASKCTMCINGDFLQLDCAIEPFNKVEYILLDPSCSGSWMSSREEDAWNPVINADDEKKIEKLASFQELALKKAMSFPNVRRIVYSTCSINERENEVVISNVLAKNNAFRLAEVPYPLSNWNRRGTVGLAPDMLNRVLRACPNEDKCHGFFVACLERV